MVGNTTEIAFQYHHHGYIPLRIDPDSKAARHQGWQVETPSDGSIERSFSRPSNLGIRCGDPRPDKTSLMALDVDVEDPDIHECVKRAIGQEVPTKRGKKGATYFVRVDYEQRTTKIKLIRGGNKRDVIDVLARGAQTVVPPSIHPETKQPYQWIAGTPLHEIDYRQLPVFEASLIDEIRGYLKNPDDAIYKLNSMEWAGVGGGGNTHDTCVSAVASMVARHWSDLAIYDRIQRAKREACEAAGMDYIWPESQKVIQGWIDSAREKGFASSAGKPRKLSHGTAADAFLDQVRPNILFEWERKCWYAFRGSHWVADQDPLVRHLIEQFLPEEMRNRGMIDGIERSLRDRPSLIASKDGWDRDTHLLNTPGGVYDLQTGECRPARPDDRMTRCTSVSPDFNIGGSLWARKLPEWFGDDPEDADYHQRLAGYFCTGQTREHNIVLWLGPGGDGKSVITGAYAHALGSYAGVATDTAFLETRHGQHSEELAMLQGFRLVRLSEMSGPWREDRIKQVSGGESVTAAYKHAHNFTYTPQFKLLVTANEPPRLRSVGRDMSRRFHVYKFVRGVKQIDTQLPDKLRAEAAIVLGWMILGAVKYYRDGLHKPMSVIAASNEYFLDSDWGQQWLDECTELGEDFRISQVWAYESFRQFMEGQGYSPHRIPIRATFMKRLEAKGIVRKNAVLEKGKNPVPALIGIRIKQSDDIF